MEFKVNYIPPVPPRFESATVTLNKFEIEVLQTILGNIYVEDNHEIVDFTSDLWTKLFEITGEICPLKNRVYGSLEVK